MKQLSGLGEGAMSLPGSMKVDRRQKKRSGDATLLDLKNEEGAMR